jgi:hypothetical protein
MRTELSPTHRLVAWPQPRRYRLQIGGIPRLHQIRAKHGERVGARITTKVPEMPSGKACDGGGLCFWGLSGPFSSRAELEWSLTLTSRELEVFPPKNDAFFDRPSFLHTKNQQNRLTLCH